MPFQTTPKDGYAYPVDKSERKSMTDHMMQQLFDEKIKTERLRQQLLKARIRQADSTVITNKTVLEQIQKTMEAWTAIISRDVQ